MKGKDRRIEREEFMMCSDYTSLLFLRNCLPFSSWNTRSCCSCKMLFFSNSNLRKGVPRTQKYCQA